MARKIDSIFWGLNVEEYRTVRTWYQEAKKPAEDVFRLEKELDNNRQECKIIELSITDHLGPNIDDADQISWRSLWDAHDRQRHVKEEKLARKRMDVEHLMAEIKSREEPLKKLAESCSALLCSPTAASVHTSLPRELRDQIYEYLWDQGHIDAIDRLISPPSGYHNTVPDGSILQGQDFVLPAPYFADARFVGEDFAREAATLFFRRLTEAEVHYRLVCAYIQTEKFGNMTFRPRDVIRCLVIDIAWLIYQPEEVAYSDLQDGLNSILTLPVRQDFGIIIYLSRDLQFSRSMFRVLDIIKPTYQTLVKKGMNIKVLGYRFFTPRWRNHNDTTLDVEPKRICTTAEQMSYYFDRTPEEWLQLKEAEIRTIRQPQRRMKCLEIIDTMRRNLLDLDSLLSHETW